MEELLIMCFGYLQTGVMSHRLQKVTFGQIYLANLDN